MQPVAVMRRSREFVEHEMHLFIGKLMRGRVAGIADGRPRLNFGSFSIPFESELELHDGEIATFRVVNLTKNLVTLGFVRREGVTETAAEEDIDAKVKALLNELRLPIDREHSQAARNLLKAGFAATRENIQAAVALKADPGGEGTASQVLRGLLMKEAYIPPAILASIRDYISSLLSGEPLPESALRDPSLAELLSAAEKLGRIRGQDNTSVEIQVLVRRIAEGLKSLSADEPDALPVDYRIAAVKRTGAEAALVRAFQAFVPKFISGLHPDDPLRLLFEQFASVARELSAAQTPAMARPVPLEVIPAFIEFMQGDASLAGSLKDMLSAFSDYLRSILSATETSADVPRGAEARDIQNNAALNIGRLLAVLADALRESPAPIGRDLLHGLLQAAETLASKGDGMRLAEWLLAPARPGSENLPVVGFNLPDGGRGSISLHPGVRRREDEGEDVPAGGRLVYEGEGIGRIEIGLEYGADGLSAIFIAERRDSFDDIQAGLPRLNESLDARNIKVKSLRCMHRVKRAEGEAPEDGTGEMLSGGLDVKA